MRSLSEACRALLSSEGVQKAWPLNGTKRAEKPSDTFSQASATVRFRQLLAIQVALNASTDDVAETFEATITARRICRFCREPLRVPVEMMPGTLAEIADNVPEAIADEMEKRGWKAGACPLCAFARSEQLREEHNADADRAEVGA